MVESRISLAVGLGPYSCGAGLASHSARDQHGVLEPGHLINIRRLSAPVILKKARGELLYKDTSLYMVYIDGAVIQIIPICHTR